MTPGGGRRAAHAACAAAGLALAGCGTIDAIRGAIADFVRPDPVRARVETLHVQAEAGANRDSATALDIVFVYDAKAIEQLPKSGPEWFARKAELVALLAAALDVVALQIPPLTQRAAVGLPRRHAGAVHVVAFAAYFEKNGQAAITLTPLRRPLITLKPDSVAWAED